VKYQDNEEERAILREGGGEAANDCTHQHDSEGGSEGGREAVSERERE